jgi:methylene-tetrahydromethanopterin dehydrogenase
LVHASIANKPVGIGALAIGNIKYQLQQALLASMLSNPEPLFLDFRDAFRKARSLV